MGILRISAAVLALHAVGAAASLRQTGAPPAPRAFATVAVSAHELKPGDRVKPELDPQSDHVFFKKDYPHDTSPAANWMDGHRPTTGVYPGFQTDDVYDKDYVKDENGDGGEWAAQSKFDRLRTAAETVKRDVDQAHKTEEGKGKDMASDKDAAAAAAAAAEKARKDAEAARARHDAAEKNRKSLDDAIAKWRAKVEELEKAVAECKKRVAEKTAILEKLLKEEPGQSSAVAAEQKKAKQDLEAAKEKLERIKAAKPDGVQTQFHELATEEATLLARLQASERAHDKALAQYQKSKQVVAKVEEEVRAVIQRIRRAREARAHPKVEAPKAATPAPGAARPVVEAAESLWHRFTGEVSR